jgi:hypothetical protein
MGSIEAWPGRRGQGGVSSHITIKTKSSKYNSGRKHHFMTFSFKPSMAMWHQVDLTILDFRGYGKEKEERLVMAKDGHVAPSRSNHSTF